MLDVEERAVVTEFVSKHETYTSAFTYILVILADGSRSILDPALTNVLNFWSGLLRDLRIADYPVRPVPDYKSTAIRRSEAKQLGFEAMRGIDWQPVIELRRFNLDTGLPESCDLSAADIQMRISATKRP